MLNRSARLAKSDFESEGSVKFFVRVRGVMKKRVLRALMDPFLALTLSFSDCQCCAN